MEERPIDVFLTTVERILKILIGIAIFPVGIYFLVKYYKKDVPDANGVSGDQPLIIGNISSDSDKPVETSTTDKPTQDALGKIIKPLVLFFFLPTLMWANLEKKYDQIHENISNNVITEEEKNNLSTRYTIIATEQPTKIMYPEYHLKIYNNKTYIVSNVQPKYIIEYDMGKHGIDNLIVDTKPIITIEYTNELTNVDLILQKPQSKLNIFLGTAFTYNQTQLVNYTLIGYKFFEWKGFSVIPTIGFNLLSTNHSVDIFPMVSYNIKNYIDVGICVSLLKFEYGLSIGLTF